jgi:hypothetical protein
MPLDLGKFSKNLTFNNMLRYVPRSLDKMPVDLRLGLIYQPNCLEYDESRQRCIGTAHRG